MFKLHSVFSFLLCAMLVSTQAPMMTQAASNSTFINLHIDQIKILGDVGDISSPGELRLIILATDTTGKHSGVFCPDDAPLKVHKEDTVDVPCPLAVSFDENQVSDGVYLTVMAVNEDKSPLPVDLSYEIISAKLADAFGRAVKGGAIKVEMTKSNPYTFNAELLFNLLSGKVEEWIKRADIIGSQGIYLSRKDNWSADKTNTVTSSDGGFQIIYSIVRTLSTPLHPTTPVLVNVSGSSQISSQSYWCDDLSYVKLKVGDRAKVLWEKVNLRTTPIVPQEYYENSIAKLDKGVTLTIISGPTCAHEGTWWQVRTKDGQIGWVRERTNSAGYMIERITTLYPTQTLQADLPNPTQTIQAAFNEIDRQFENLPTASIAFNKPEQMRKDETTNIELILDMSMSETALATQLVAQGGFATSTADPNLLIGPNGENNTIETGQIEITPRVKAVLLPQDADAFFVKEMQDNTEQVVSTVNTTVWRWSVTAKKEGRQTLVLTIYQLVKYDNKEFWHNTATYTANIDVNVTASDRIKSMDWKWVAGFILTLVGAVLGVLTWLNNRIKEKKEEKSKEGKPVKKARK